MTCSFIDSLLSQAHNVLKHERNGGNLTYFKQLYFHGQPADLSPLTARQVKDIKNEFNTLFNPYNPLSNDSKKAIKLIQDITIQAVDTCYSCSLELYYQAQGFKILEARSTLNAMI